MSLFTRNVQTFAVIDRELPWRTTNRVSSSRRKEASSPGGGNEIGTVRCHARIKESCFARGESSLLNDVSRIIIAPNQ